MQFARLCGYCLRSKVRKRVVEFSSCRMYSNRQTKENIVQVREALFEIYEEYVHEYSEDSGETPKVNNDDIGRNDKVSNSG